MRLTTSARVYGAVLCLVVLVVGAIAACSLTAAAPAGNIITIALPETDAAVYLDADGVAAFSGTNVQYIGQAGEPALPSQSIRVLLPPDADLSTVKATVAGYRWTGVDGKWDIAPVGPFAIGDGGDTSAVSPADEAGAGVRDAGIYESDALFPLEPVRKVDVQVMRGWKMAQILYAPMAYNPVEKKVFQLSGNNIEITFERTSAKSSSANTDLTGAGQVRDMTVNFAEMAGEYGGYAVSSDTGRYVIITTSAIQAASSDLMDFVASKEARGFTVQVVTEETWQGDADGDTGDAAAEHIRSWLQTNYLSLNIKYVLLIGNPNPFTGTVPMKMCYPQEYDLDYDDCPTDFYYAELTSNDWDKDGDGKYGEYTDDFSGNPPRAAEVAVGRIPYYGSISDLDHILSKIIAYEAELETDISWHRNVLLPMKPSDEDTPGYQLGEEIKDDILVPAGWTYHRAYDQYNTYCNPDCLLSIPADTETVPCTIANVTNAWNGSDFGAVFWWTHGSETSAADVMDLSHAATLDDAHPGFTFQASCLNGAPETTTNLGYSLLKNGCIATVSASRVSWYEKGQTSFAGTPTNSGMTFEYAQRLIAGEMYAGDALNDLRADISPYDEVLWMNYLDFNLYGCPAVGLYTPPLAETDGATSITTSTAQLHAELVSLGTADSAVTCFEWGTALGGPYPNVTDNQTLIDVGVFSDNLTGLDLGTTYYYRAKGVGWGIGYGSEMTFATLAPPSVSTGTADPVTATSATLNGNLISMGTASSVTVSFEWGESILYGNETSLEVITDSGSFSANLPGLDPKTPYYFRAKADGDGAPVYGLPGSFTTPGISPSVTTGDPSDITPDGARLWGDLTDLGTADSVTVSFEWGYSSGSYGNETIPAEVMTANGPFYFDLDGLAKDTTFYYRAKAVGDGTAYGEEQSFKTGTIPPSVTTGAAIDVLTTSATLTGSLDDLGTAASVSVYFLWGTTDGGPYPNTTTARPMDSTGVFSADRGGLTPGTTYYFVARAVGDGARQGDQMIFTTLEAPTVITGDASDVTITSATLHGDLSDLGSAAGVGVCFQWGTAPGVYDDETTVEVKDSPGTFEFSLTDLTPGIAYYYRAKAMGDGTSYGVEKNFTTFRAPEVSSVDPRNWRTGQRLTVIITGTDFTGATAVSFGADVVVDSFTVVSAARISVAVYIPCDGTSGTRDVVVTTPGGTDTLANGFTITVSAPNRPQNASPADDAGIMTLTPTLSASAFSHVCLLSTHAASQWQVTAKSGDYGNPLDDTTVGGGDLTSFTLPMGVIGSPQQYWWRVRYQDNGGAWSGWSEETSFYRPDFIRAELDGSAEIRVYDSTSGLTGSVDGEGREEIADSEYVDGTVVLFSPTGSYRYEVVGAEGGSYTLVVTRAVGDGSVTFRATGIPVSAGEVHQYLIDWEALSRGGNSVTISIDSDGDGTFEKTVVMDGEIGTKEFAAATKEKGIPPWVWILLGVSVVAGIAAALVLWQADRRKKQTAAPA